MFDTGRLLYKGLLSLGRPRIDTHDVSTVWLRVLPTDLDVFLHVTNSKYIEIMNVGRLDYVIRSGWLKTALKKRAIMIVGSASFQYRRSVRVWQKLKLETRLIYWDSKWIFFEHKLFHSGHLSAQGIVKVLFRSRLKRINPADIMAESGQMVSSPEMPDVVSNLLAAEQSREFASLESKFEVVS